MFEFYSQSCFDLSQGGEFWLSHTAYKEILRFNGHGIFTRESTATAPSLGPRPNASLHEKEVTRTTMEFAIIGFVLRVVPLGAKVLKGLHAYYGDVAKAPEQVMRLRQELGTVLAIVDTLKETIEHSPSGFQGTQKQLEEALQEFERVLKEMEARVQEDQGKGVSRLLWPFRNESNKKYLDRIERCKSSFILALNTENTYIRCVRKLMEVRRVTRQLRESKK